MSKLKMLPALCCAKRCYKLNLQLFGEGTGAAGTAGAGETSGESPAGNTPGGAENGQDAAAADTEKPATENNSPEKALSSAPDKTAEFEKLIRGEYKEQFTQRLQHILEKRLKAAKAGQAEAEPSTATDEQKMSRAAEEICRNWAKESHVLKQQYPNFTFDTEAKNPAFASMLKAGVPLKNAYEACHLDELLGGAMQFTADKAFAAAAKQYAARAARPAENGTIARAGAVMKTDVSRLSRTEREAIERRAVHGERIRF